MSIDLTQFEGKQPTEIIRTLVDAGYEEVGSGQQCTVFALPGDDRVLKISSFTASAAAFDKLCHANEDNPHFPKIYDSYEIKGNPGTYLTVVERLESNDDIPEELKSIVCGFGRAAALIIDGHESHIETSEMFMKDETVSKAVWAIVGTIEDQLQKGEDTAFAYDRNYRGDQDIETWYPDNIMYRPIKENRWQVVFADPFRELHAGSTETRQRLESALTEIKGRLTMWGEKKEGPAVLPQGPSL